MTCKDCRYNSGSLDGCMFSHGPDQDACKLYAPEEREEDEYVGKRD